MGKLPIQIFQDAGFDIELLVIIEFGVLVRDGVMLIMNQEN